MVAIVAGQSLGLGQTSARTLGSGGVLGNPAAGYLGSSFFVNAASGNVVIQNQDEILTGVGQDMVLSRTYNSLGLLDDDNGDNWRESSQRTVAGLTGTVNTAGSTITRTDWDGSRQVFTWDAAKSAYVYKDPAGSFDKLTYSAGSNQWTWTDGDSRVTELYDNVNGGRIVSSLDADGKGQAFTYTGSQLTRITDSNGEYVSLTWSGTNLTQLSTYKSDNTLLVSRVRYGYDGSNRLTTVTVDLSPSDNTIADGKTVVYDANGNATLLLQSIGSVNLKSGSFADASSMLANTGISKTISVFDARNQLSDTIQANSNNLGASAVHATQVSTSGTGTAYFNSSASVVGANRAGTGATAGPVWSPSTVSATSAGSISLDMTATNGRLYAIHLDIQNLPANGGGNIHIEMVADYYAGDWCTGMWLETGSVDLGSWAGSSSNILITDAGNRAGWLANGGITFSRLVVWREGPGGVGRINLLQTQMGGGALSNGTLNGTAYTAPQIQFQNESPSTSVIRIFGRQQGSGAQYQWLGTASPLTRADGSAVAGWYNFDTSGLGWQNWELLYYAVDGVGNILDAKSAIFGCALNVRMQAINATITYSSLGDFSYLDGYNLATVASPNPSASWADLYLRPLGTSQVFSYSSTSQIFHESNPYFTADFTSFPIGNLVLVGPSGTTGFEFQIAYRDANGNTLGVSSGVLDGNLIPQPGIASSPLPVNGPGQALMFSHNDGSLLFSGLPSNTQNVRVYYGQIGSGGAFTWLDVYGGAYGQQGWWWGTPPSWGGPYEFWVEPVDWNGNLVAPRSYGTFYAGGQPSALTQYVELPKTVAFSPPSGHTVTNQRMRYFANGSWSGWIDYLAGGVWNFDAGSLAPNFYSSYSYQVEYETYDGPTLISRAAGTMALGYNGQGISLTNEQGTTAKVQFNPLQTAGSQLRLFWRDQGSTGEYTAAILNKSGASYAWDVDGVRPSSGTRVLEYYYDVYDASGNLLPALTGSDHVQGTITISSDSYANTSQSEIRWALDTAAASQFLIHRSQAHNAFGEISSETDGRGNTTDLVYNTEGKLTQKIAPLVGVTNEAGVTTNARPIEYYYYDKSGRQVAQRDANGNLTTQVLLAGTGYGGSKALAVAEYRPGSFTTSGYDVWGDQRKVTDSNGAVTWMVYDAGHNVTEVHHPVRAGGNSSGVQLVDFYAYDALGQRIKHWNSQFGPGILETTDYDAMGRVTRTVSYGGQTTDYGYYYYAAGSGGINTPGLGDFGGWHKITGTSAGIVSYENLDIFGHLSWRRDYGGHDYQYVYDLAGHLVLQVNSAGQNIQFSYYENGYVSSVTDNALKLKSTFEYDNNGNRTLETYNSTDANPVYYQNAAITYDALNRMTRFLDAKADITYKYDAAGNRRNVRSEYQDGVGGGLQVQDFWYKYDGQNRFVLTMGTLSGGIISRGTTGVDITYDGAGNRATAIYGYDNHSEDYTYTADGYLEDTYISGVRRSSRTADAMGRVTQYTEYAPNGYSATLSRSSTYDNDNRVTGDTTDTISGATTTRAVQTYDYRLFNGTSYSGADQGVVTHVRADNFTVGQNNHVYTDTNTYYTYWDEAKQSSIRINASNPNNPNSGLWAPGMSSLTYDVNGHITTLVDQTAQGGATTVKYRNDAYGQVLVREESKNGVIGPRQLYYYFAGARIGDVGNNGASPNLVDYAQQLAMRGSGQPTGFYRNGGPVASADFDENYQPINAGHPGGAATSYTVRDGDTLYSIARALWGDQAMWFLIAEANGITAATQLVPGQRLIIPNKVTNFHNTSGTFRVYDPGEAIGDTMPTLPNEPAPPPVAKKKGGCGGLGAILLAIVAIAVTVVTAGAALSVVAPTAFPTVGAGISAVVTGSVVGAAGVGVGLGTAIAVGAGAAAMGSIVSQGIGVATGLQDSFNWKAVGLSALGGGLAGAASGLNVFGSGATGAAKIANVVVRSALTNAAMQGIGVATGLQDKFGWSGVAAAGVGAGVGPAIAGGKFASGLGPVGGPIISGVAGGLAVSAAESLITGRNFGDTLMGNLPGMIVNTVGSIVANRVTARAGVVTGAGDGAAARPTVGEGGGQVGGSSDVDEVRPGDIVVTARRGRGYSPVTAQTAQVVAQTTAGSSSGGDVGGAAAAASLSRGNHPYPADPEDMSGNTVWQLRAKKAAYLDAVAKSGQTFTDNELNIQAFDDLIAQADAKEAPGLAAANAAEKELLRAGLAPFDIAAGGYNIATGNGSLRDYLAVGSIVPVGKALGAVGSVGETVTARAARLGAEGERSVGLFGPKVGIRIPGNNRLRIPDNLDQTTRTLIEVKNVASQSYTRQLRDFAAYSQSKGLTFELYVRPSTRVSNTILQAQARGELILKYIPGAK